MLNLLNKLLNFKEIKLSIIFNQYFWKDFDHKVVTEYFLCTRVCAGHCLRFFESNGAFISEGNRLYYIESMNNPLIILNYG